MKMRMKTNSPVWVQTADDSIHQVEEEFAMICPILSPQVVRGKGSTKNDAISLPHQVTAASLELILDYCRFHQVPGRCNKDRRAYDKKLANSSCPATLCELACAADSLQLKPLVDLTTTAIARNIEGKSAEEMREALNLPDKLITVEEKLEPIPNRTNCPHIRLLNRLFARKRKVLEERKKQKNVNEEVEGELGQPPRPTDERSVDELLSFINGGGDGDSNNNKGDKKMSKKKKKNRKRPKDRMKNVNDNSKDPVCEDSKSVMHFPEFEFDDDYTDDELDPAQKEELDREVEDFARRLNSVWDRKDVRVFVPSFVSRKDTFTSIT
ncbi:OLC1v1005540C1 [Oldenlandia corymbosa var. corymbosa]|uniref:OLC1v1005540C1 n=1 Tax=Oldenlandia corymbosa var. corymbosa TaxID=529605 RepID=A0AAV1DG43_OLDCO|nr:OLC1v1005540C1 [Oldenlandia corymbosa var. corymbosa]